MLKKDGILFLGLPIGPDHIETNHRIYGKYRLQLFLPMWETIDLINNRLHLNESLENYLNQPMWILKKKSL